MEISGGRSTGAIGRFEMGMAGIGVLSAPGATAPDGRDGVQEPSLLPSQLDASARNSDASLVRHLSPLASERVRVQAVRT
jgi:hypothetical protein